MSESSSAQTGGPTAGPALPGAARRMASRWIHKLSKQALAVVLVLFLTFIHAIGLAVFTHGFLLTRHTIPNVSPAYNLSNPAPLEATHSKAVVIIIDALRTDFISPFYPEPKSPHHHGVLTLPAELTAAQPYNSLIFDSFSDPPTTTMQRLKGLTTGSLPTFIDAGSNFASTEIEEDSLISQLVAANKSVVFMGDDTWLNLFPNAFTHAHPYDSFNVEDLHTVDNGVIEHLFPYMHPSNSSKWDFLIGHFLGVDHVGHRVGPSKDTMREKLQQMDDVLRKVVDVLEEDTLLVVLGDHGMNPKGDHGGDSDLETSAALWLYSKGAPLSGPQAESTWKTSQFPGSSVPIRHVNQIDLVPTLALLLGIPIPYNNLGSVIPEPFSRSRDELETALRVNTEQIERYLATYGNQEVLRNVAEAHRAAQQSNIADTVSKSIHESSEVQIAALNSLRQLWAQFSVSHIAIGAAILFVGLLANLSLYLGVRNGGPNWDIYVRESLDTASTIAASTASVIGTAAGLYTRDPAPALQVFFVAFAGIASLVIALPLAFSRTFTGVSWSLTRAIGPIVLAAHALSFASNSFVMWEDRVVLYLLVTIAMVYFWRALTAPMASLRLRILGFSLVFAALVRLLSVVSICREEQQPYCKATFYLFADGPHNNAIYLSIFVAVAVLPRIIAVVLSWSKSYSGPAPFFIALAWRFILIFNATYWLLDWLETYDGLVAARVPLVKFVKRWLARMCLGACLGFLPYVWANSGLAIEVVRQADQTNGEEQVGIYGFGNVFGSSYLLFLMVPFALVHLVSLPVAQITLSGCFVALLAYLELIDAQRDAIMMKLQFSQSSQAGAFEPQQGSVIVRPSFTDAVPIALLGLLGFFVTGHQAVLASIQWKSAFIGFDVVTYPWSPAMVVLNTWGPLLLAALAVPLVAVWNISPKPNGSVPVLAHTVQLCLAFMTYFTTITLASAITAAWLRRHLMVWKVFAPRFMLAGITLLVIDIGLVLGLVFGFRITANKIFRTFKSVSV